MIVDEKGLGREGDMEILEDGSFVNRDRNNADSLPPERHAKYYKGAGLAIVCCSDYAGEFMSLDISTDHDSSGKFRVAYVKDGKNAAKPNAIKSAARNR